MLLFLIMEVLASFNDCSCYDDDAEVTWFTNLVVEFTNKLLSKDAFLY